MLKLPEIASFTAVTTRIGVIEAADTFQHPGVPEDSPLREHVLYRLTRGQWMESFCRVSADNIPRLWRYLVCQEALGGLPDDLKAKLKC